jgi:glycosyl transferase family 4
VSDPGRSLTYASKPKIRSGERTEPGTDDRGLRVLVLTNMYPTHSEPDFGCFVKDQVDDLRRLGVDVSVLAFDGRSDKRRYLAAAARLRQTLRRNRYDIVHAHYGLSGAVASLQRAAPVVTTFHGSDAWVQKPWQRRVSWLVARRTQPIAVAPIIAAG